MRITPAILCAGATALVAVIAVAGPLSPPPGPVDATSPSLADIQAAVAGAGAPDTASTPGSATDGRPWPAPGEMRVEFVDGLPLAGSWTIADLAGSIEVLEFRQGGEPGVIPLPGNHLLPAVTLIRPLNQDRSASAWFEQVVGGDIAGARVDATLILYDGQGSAIASWRLLDCWPHAYDTRIDGAAASEQITITMEALQRTQ